MNGRNAQAIPDSLIEMLSNADSSNGFPAGTMFSIMQQEVGGNSGKYLQDPSAYHYGLNAEGKRIAGHTGKVSTAFGPFGILESTGAQPGYGVKPLQNKTIEEQVRFSGQYLAARSKQAGSLAGGLAGYGEGAKYAQQVAARIGGQPAPVPMAAPPPVPQSVQGMPVAAPEPQAPMHQPVPDVAPVNPQWAALQEAAPQQAQELTFGKMDMPKIAMPTVVKGQPNFGMLSGWTGRV
jgi:hypothetical protein